MAPRASHEGSGWLLRWRAGCGERRRYAAVQYVLPSRGKGGRAQWRSTARHLGIGFFEDGRRSCGYHSASHNGVDVVVREDRRLFACWLGPRGAAAAERPAPYALLAQRRPFQRRSPGQGVACSHEGMKPSGASTADGGDADVVMVCWLRVGRDTQCRAVVLHAVEAIRSPVSF